MELKSTLEVEAILDENEKLLIEWKALQYKARTSLFYPKKEKRLTY